MFCWAGVAAPVQRYFRGLSSRLVGGAVGVTCEILEPGVRPARCGGEASAYAPVAADATRVQRWQASFSIAGSREPSASDLGSVTPGSPLDPVVGGSLEDAFCCLISWCIWHVQLASAKIKCHTHVPSACIWHGYLCGTSWCTHQEPGWLMRKEATSSAGSAQVHWQPHGSQARTWCHAPRAAQRSRADGRPGRRAAAVLAVQGEPHGDRSARRDRLATFGISVISTG